MFELVGGSGCDCVAVARGGGAVGAVKVGGRVSVTSLVSIPVCNCKQACC